MNKLDGHGDSAENEQVGKATPGNNLDSAQLLKNFSDAKDSAGAGSKTPEQYGMASAHDLLGGHTDAAKDASKDAGKDAPKDTAKDGHDVQTNKTEQNYNPREDHHAANKQVHDCLNHGESVLKNPNSSHEDVRQALAKNDQMVNAIMARMNQINNHPLIQAMQTQTA